MNKRGLKLFAGVKPSCATCQFFSRYKEQEARDTVQAVLASDDPVEVADPDLIMEFGKCRRYPPTFFWETLNGAWPVVHESSVCGEYRVQSDNPYI